ncbi:MAG TPA: hypothetical protein VLH86_03505 [Patescibacteria group bacterium]|nr:hypothetical protein [Patescibacteria group bacterium]
MDYSQYKQIEFRRRFWTFIGAKITVHPAGNDAVIGFIHMKGWRLREDVRLYTDETLQHELLRIHARNIIDFSGTYDIVDSASNQIVYTMRRKGLKSTFVRDHWDIFDPQGNTIGAVQETSSGLALARRWFGIVPYVGEIIDLAFAFAAQTYQITLNQPTGPAAVGIITHHKNPFVVKMTLDTSAAPMPVDPRLTMSATALLSIIDASKNS